MKPEMQLNLDALITENNHLQGRLSQLEHLLDFVPALITISEFIDITKPHLVRNIWANSNSLSFIGYTREELDEMDYHLIDYIIPAEDIPLLKAYSTAEELLRNLRSKPKRFKAKDGSYKWLQIRGGIYQQDEESQPLQFVFVAFELPNNTSFSNAATISSSRNLDPTNILQFNLPTVREREILKLIAKGHTDKEIAELLFISVKTAQTHRNKLVKKLGVKNTAALVAYVFSNGLF